MKTPEILINAADNIENKIKQKYPDLAPLAKQCFLNTIETTVKECANGDFFVITGDIPAMWLRDSASQLKHYSKYAKDDEDLRKIFRGVIRRHIMYVNFDPYSNAFNEVSNPKSHKDDTDFSSELIWERKYETDSLCSSIYLSYYYFTDTGDESIFTDDFRLMLLNIYKTFVLEQNHFNDSRYYFNRKNCCETDTLPCNGNGNPVAHTGMTWSGFRPSDDRCIYNYLVPANMMASVAMKYAAAMIDKGYKDKENSDKMLRLSQEIRESIYKYAVVEHPKYGRIFAYEVDGLGNVNLMDDANSPSLLSAPFLGFCDKKDDIYLNTRRFILSEDNPWYFCGTCAKGIGSPHTGKDRIWHISLIMQILTTDDEAEKEYCLKTLASTHDNTFFMHESFNKDDPSVFSRKWFAWANSLFALMLDESI